MASSKKYGILSYEDDVEKDTSYHDQAFIYTSPHLWNLRDIIEVSVWILFSIILLILYNTMHGCNNNKQKNYKKHTIINFFTVMYSFLKTE